MSYPTQFDFAQHLRDQMEFSRETFGPGQRTAGVVDHIRKELREIEVKPSDLEEWIDVILLACDGAWRTGVSPEQIITALESKLAKNMKRTWPDWRTAEPDKAIEHDRSAVDIEDGESDLAVDLSETNYAFEEQVEHTKIIQRQRDALAGAIAEAAKKAGIWNGDVGLTGPHLLMLCDDMATCIIEGKSQWDELCTSVGVGKLRDDPAEAIKAATDAQAHEPIAYVRSHELEAFTNADGAACIEAYKTTVVKTDVPLYTHPAPSQAVGELGDRDWRNGPTEFEDSNGNRWYGYPTPSQAVATAGDGVTDSAAFRRCIEALREMRIAFPDPDRSVYREATEALAQVDAMSTPSPSQPVATDGDGVTEAAASRACELFDPIGWEHMGADSRADFKASMRRVLEDAALASPSAPRVGVPEGWKIERDGTRIRVTRPDGTVSEWSNRPANNGSGMYDLCMALAAALEVPHG